jgi:hypothetical protein
MQCSAVDCSGAVRGPHTATAPSGRLTGREGGARGRGRRRCSCRGGGHQRANGGHGRQKGRAHHTASAATASAEQRGGQRARRFDRTARHEPRSTTGRGGQRDGQRHQRLRVRRVRRQRRHRHCQNRRRTGARAERSAAVERSRQRRNGRCALWQQSGSAGAPPIAGHSGRCSERQRCGSRRLHRRRRRCGRCRSRNRRWRRIAVHLPIWSEHTRAATGEEDRGRADNDNGQNGSAVRGDPLVFFVECVLMFIVKEHGARDPKERGLSVGREGAGQKAKHTATE